jgi:hypothetical protein
LNRVQTVLLASLRGLRLPWFKSGDRSPDAESASDTLRGRSRVASGEVGSGGFEPEPDVLAALRASGRVQTALALDSRAAGEQRRENGSGFGRI